MPLKKTIINEKNFAVKKSTILEQLDALKRWKNKILITIFE